MAKIQRIIVPDVPPPVSHYCHVTRAGPHVWVAGVVGTAQVNVVADSRIGEEVNEIAEVLDVQVLPAEAVSLGISAGAPEEQ